MRRAFGFILFASAAWAQKPDITPVFTKYCMSCHSAGVKMGGFDLETAEGLKAGGHRGPVIVEGKPEESRLYQMIVGTFKPVMPMDGSKLAKGEIDLVADWIRAGAPPMKAVEKAENNTSYAPRVVPKPQIFSLAISPDGKTIAVGGFREVRLLDATSGRVKSTLKGSVDAVRSLAFSKDGKLLVGAGGLPSVSGEVKVWNAANGELLFTFKGHKDNIYAVAVSPDGETIATSSYDKMIRLWNLNGTSRELKDHIDAVYALAFTPDGKRLVSGAADRTVKVWDVATGTRLFTLSEPADGINTVAVSPDGKLIAAAGQDKTIRLWTLGEKSGELLNTYIAHEDAILHLAFSPDGKQLVSTSSDRSVKLFAVPELNELRVLASQPDWPLTAEFTPDGHSLAIGRFDGSLSIYDTTTFQDRAATTRASR